MVERKMMRLAQLSLVLMINLICGNAFAIFGSFELGETPNGQIVESRANLVFRGQFSVSGEGLDECNASYYFRVAGGGAGDFAVDNRRGILNNNDRATSVAVTLVAPRNPGEYDYLITAQLKNCNDELVLEDCYHNGIADYENCNLVLYDYNATVTVREITCDENSDCGQDGCVENITGCSLVNSNKVYCNYITRECRQPGTFDASCVSSSDPQHVVEECGNNKHCEGGQCVDDPCINRCDEDERRCNPLEHGAQICVRDEDGCFDWGEVNVCAEIEQCRNGVCEEINEQPTAVITNENNELFDYQDYVLWDYRQRLVLRADESFDSNRDRLTYVWEKDDEIKFFTQQAEFDFTEVDFGSHIIKLTVSDGELSDSVELPIAVYDPSFETMWDVKNIEQIGITVAGFQEEAYLQKFFVPEGARNLEIYFYKYNKFDDITMKLTRSDGSDCELRIIRPADCEGDQCYSGSECSNRNPLPGVWELKITSGLVWEENAQVELVFSIEVPRQYSFLRNCSWGVLSGACSYDQFDSCMGCNLALSTIVVIPVVGQAVDEIQDVINVIVNGTMAIGKTFKAMGVYFFDGDDTVFRDAKRYWLEVGIGAVNFVFIFDVGTFAKISRHIGDLPAKEWFAKFLKNSDSILDRFKNFRVRFRGDISKETQSIFNRKVVELPPANIPDWEAKDFAELDHKIRIRGSRLDDMDSDSLGKHTENFVEMNYRVRTLRPARIGKGKAFDARDWGFEADELVHRRINKMNVNGEMKTLGVDGGLDIDFSLEDGDNAYLFFVTKSGSTARVHNAEQIIKVKDFIKQNNPDELRKFSKVYYIDFDNVDLKGLAGDISIENFYPTERGSYKLDNIGQDGIDVMDEQGVEELAMEFGIIREHDVDSGVDNDSSNLGSNNSGSRNEESCNCSLNNNKFEIKWLGVLFILFVVWGGRKGRRL